MTDTISNRSSGLEGLNQKGGFGRTLELPNVLYIQNFGKE